MKSLDILRRIEKLADPDAVEGMAKVGITAEKVYGVKIPHLRALAKEIGKHQAFSLELWAINSRETRILASMIGEIGKVTASQMDSWAGDFDSWEVCDQCIMNLFEKLPDAWSKALEWSEDDKEFVKRAGFVMMARLAVSDKKAEDWQFEALFPHILREATDDRNMVKKAVNWAIRQIGKRNMALREKAINLLMNIQALDTKSARWIAADAIRELESDAVIERLKQKCKNRQS